MAEQTEKAYLKQPKVFLSSKKSGKGKRPGKGGNRFYKSIGLNLKTPREAIEGEEDKGSWKAIDEGHREAIVIDFVNEVVVEAKEYMDNNRDEYGSKKAIQHVLSNHVNDAGFSRPEAYMDPDPYKPGPSYLREEHI
ncbi:hypothetical protein IFM89_014793 [Coptis chinensis]|uniref:Small ribosomal subunit protein uS17 N-terminal domain-containing protein n=1 Tax=Coptis chinensis TaxID=261450 RepID=A0A835IDW6_9MAGN|nr:hypothetical protein IFM89_014793 [Coptis chinensis]